jgi:ATP-dependent Clp protease ATP-binding subunit ClpA
MSIFLIDILRVNASVGADVLREMGITLEKIREALRSIRTSEPPAPEDVATDPTAEPDRITPTFRYAIEDSVRGASCRRERYVRADHLLLALIDRRMPNISQRLFTHLGIDIHLLFTTLDERVHHTLYPPSPASQIPWYRRLANRLRKA